MNDLKLSVNRGAQQIILNRDKSKFATKCSIYLNKSSWAFCRAWLLQSFQFGDAPANGPGENPDTMRPHNKYRNSLSPTHLRTL